jgi:Lrp/AsnC ligand binding domain
MSVEAYVFITTTNPGPRNVCRAIRRLPGVVRADALFGTPDVVAIVTGDDIARMDSVIDRIVELPEVIGTDSKVVRWIQ